MVGTDVLGDAIGLDDFENIAVEKARLAKIDRALVALIETATQFDLLLDDLVGVIEDILKGQSVTGRVDRIERIAVVFYQAADRVTQGLGRNRTPVGTTAADVVGALDYGHFLAEFGQSHGGAFAAGAGADHYGVIVGADFWCGLGVTCFFRHVTTPSLLVFFTVAWCEGDSIVIAVRRVASATGPDG